MNKESYAKCFLAGLTAVIFWSASFIATKYVYLTFRPIMTGFLRFLLVTCFWLIIRCFQKNREKPEKEDLKKIAVSAFFGITTYYALENLALSYTTASNASLITAAFPAISVLFEFLVYHNRPSLRTLIGILTAFSGIAVLTVISDSSQSTNILLGNLLLICAGVLWPVYNFSTKSFIDRYQASTISYYQSLFGSLFFLPPVFLEHGTVGSFTGTSFVSLLFLTFGCSLAAYMLYNYSLKRLSSNTAVSLLNLTPVFGVIFSFLLLHETVTGTQLLGGVIVIIGVLLTTDIGK